MYKNLSLFLIPVSIFLLIGITLSNINFKYGAKVITQTKINVPPIGVHNNFQINGNNAILSNVNNLTDKISTFKNKIKVIAQTKTNILPIGVYKNFEYTYYPKTVDDNKITNSLQLVSSSWKNNFSQKKIEFIEILLPLIAFENQKIVIERQRLIKIKNYLQLQKTLVEDDIIYLNKMANKYQIKSKNKHKIDTLNRLLFSVNVIPNSIVLAQAANESGWGTSRFAKEYNALFGQYTYNEKNGIIPSEREEGKKHFVRYFSSINKSVESYFKNINTHYAYEEFRQMRSKININNLDSEVKLLTQHLDVYAEDESYVRTINSIIETNNFTQFDLINHFFVSS